MDINEKLRSLTPEQANKLAGHLNSCYPDKKKPAPAKKKPAAKGKKKYSEPHTQSRRGCNAPCGFFRAKQTGGDTLWQREEVSRAGHNPRT